MTFQSINPADGSVFASVSSWDGGQLEAALSSVASSRFKWAETRPAERYELLRRIAEILRAEREKHARLICREMGKLINEARAEVDKCALVCDYYADHAAKFLADEPVVSDAGRSYVTYQPLGTVLAVMPWNFPFWQVFRFAVPALAAGNTAVLKHAANVPLCAQAIEDIFNRAGGPPGIFRTLMIHADQVARVVSDERIHAVTLTGSTAAGRQVAAVAGAHLKKTVLELGGSDPFVVLEDAELGYTTASAVTSRFLNAGQSCIAAKRFIVVETVADNFVAGFQAQVDALATGDPADEKTTLAPMARPDLRDELHQQVMTSINKGALAVTGCAPVAGPGAFYSASIIDHVKPGMPAYDEEIFGPVACIIRVKNEREALCIANDCCFGLGASVWTSDRIRGESFARQIEAGACFVNSVVKSDPRLPFGGVKCSGYGRELSHHGIHEFLNSKTIWIR